MLLLDGRKGKEWFYPTYHTVGKGNGGGNKPLKGGGKKVAFVIAPWFLGRRRGISKFTRGGKAKLHGSSLRRKEKRGKFF